MKVLASILLILGTTAYAQVCDPICDSNAACTLVDAVPTCECNTGFDGDGASCADVDECTAGTDNCNDNAACANNDGSFTCACNSGYNGDGVTCEDNDECAADVDNCDVNAACTNTAGSFTCACNAGYAGDGVTCSGLKCYVCNDYDFDGDGAADDQCFKDLASLTSETCVDNAGVEYCRTQFRIQDGVGVRVWRSCESTGAATNTVPPDQCTIEISPSFNPTTETTCTYTCTTDDCNTQTAASLKVCSTNCGTNGNCNYLTGTCVCDFGWLGSDCSTEGPTTRNCVQCSTDTDSTCSSTTAASACPTFQQYCSTTSSIVFDRSENIINAITARGCTDAFVAVDECAFSNILTDAPISDYVVGYNEFTCYSTCVTDGCNTNTANGVVDTNEWVGLYCVQCSDTDGHRYCNAATSREVCPSGTTHCKSTVTYLISELTDRPYVGAVPAYQLRSVVRECATAEVPASCTETSVAGISGMRKITCTETCTEDGCNTGWPARPSCIQCATPEDGYDKCLENPPQPTDCPFPYQKYCTLKERGTEQLTGYAIQGYPHTIQRGCSHWDFGTGCSTVTPRDISIEICNHTCTTDGCNVGVARNGSSMILRSMLAVIGQVVP